YATKLRAEDLPLLLRDSKLAPDNSELQYQCGMALYLAGRGEEGLRYLQRAVELQPESQRYEIGLRMLRERLDSL
ncbi:MAG: hypothetical protein AAF989_05370, partial [Planctomycetota bacterium]